MRAQFDSCRTRLGRIRCLDDCLKAYTRVEPFPEPLCYTCRDVEYSCTSSYLLTHTDIATHAFPFSLPDNSETNKELTLAESLKDVIPVGSISCNSYTRFYCSGEPMVTSFGLWLKVFAVKEVKETESRIKECHPPIWVLARGSTTEEETYLEPITRYHESTNIKYSDAWKTNESLKINNWLGCVESTCSLSISTKPELSPRDEDTMAELRDIPLNWASECDEQLVHLLSSLVDVGTSNLGTIKNYVDQISVSSSCGQDDDEKLTDGDNETFWESDGNHGQHWIRLKMKRGTVISRLYITLDMDDENYLPEHVVVMGGELDNLSSISDIHVNLNDTAGIKDECVLTNCDQHYPYIEIRIKGCKDEGIDTRIHGLKIASTREAEMGLSVDIFGQKDKICRYPALETYNKRLIYRRAQILQRLVQLIDTVLNYLVPAWTDSTGALNLIPDVKHLLPLSTKRHSLIDAFLKDSESKDHRMNHSFPRLIINRRSAAEHKTDPSDDPDGTKTVFTQIYEGLKRRNPNERTLDYRWPAHTDQWWECKFVGEGIIDQGGGFRDSLCDMAEELCPPGPDDPMPLPFFIRAPNQASADSNTSRDVYVPNPSCKKLAHYKWIGQIMGACFRGRESLVLALPGFIWKKISGEKVQWALDYSSVDAAEVRLIDSMEYFDAESFDVHFCDRTWTVTLSDGQTREVRNNGSDDSVKFEDRAEYSDLAKQARMGESDAQINAIREGLLSVVPEAILNLLTWQEIEKKICGDPEITVEGLRKSVHLDELEPTDDRMKTFWEVMTSFSNEDRSKFLRFVTGRKRLPCPLYISPNKTSSIDCLPESSTCSNTLYLPKYTNVKIAEEKLRYAAYNCVAIDTDLNPWE